MNQQQFLESQKKLGQTWTITAESEEILPKKRVIHCEPRRVKGAHFGPSKTPHVRHFGFSR